MVSWASATAITRASRAVAFPFRTVGYLLPSGPRGLKDDVPPPDYGWIQCCDIPLILELRHILVAKISSAAAAANAKAGEEVKNEYIEKGVLADNAADAVWEGAYELPDLEICQ